MMIGEQYPTLAAFEEASYIQRKHYGDGAIKVAKIITNIWMIMHEELEDTMF